MNIGDKQIQLIDYVKFFNLQFSKPKDHPFPKDGSKWS